MGVTRSIKRFYSAATRHSMTDKAVQLLHKAHNDYDIEYGGFLSNHISHGLITLAQLNASDERFDKWYDAYLQHEVLGYQLEPSRKPSDVTITEDNLHEYLGKRDYFPNLYEFFQKQLERNDTAETVNKYFPLVSAGIAGSALHPMIHLGFSLDFGKCDVPIAEGLAYLVHSYLPLTDFSKFNPEESTEQLDLKTIIGQVQQDKELWNKVRTPEVISSFQSRLKLFQNSTTVLSYVSKWNALHQNPSTEEEKEKLFAEACEELATVSVFAFYNTKPASSEFFLLHGVTGCFSAIKIAKTLKSHEERMKLLFYFTYALVSVFVTEGSPDVIACSKDPNHPVSPKQDWESIVNEIIDVNSEKNDVVSFFFYLNFMLEVFMFCV